VLERRRQIAQTVAAVTTARASPLEPRRVRVDLVSPVHGGKGEVISSTRLRAPDVPDLLSVPGLEIGADLDRARRWVARLTELPADAVARVADDDLRRLADLIEPGLWSVRQAVGASPHDFELALERPLRVGQGLQLTALPLRPPLVSDYAALNWTGWLDTCRRIGPDVIEARTDFDLVARWASQLSGVDVAAVRQLSLADAQRVCGEVSALVVGFSVFVLASN